jgi:REP element-mobilizing transposase RayT
MHAYLGGTSERLGCQPLIVGGVEDHVHILARQARTISLSDWVRDLKSGSSAWVKERDPSLSRFAWQAGYGAFSVDAAAIEQVRTYIREQQEHHRKWSFQDELRKLLKDHDLDWNEKYVWD